GIREAAPTSDSNQAGALRSHSRGYEPAKGRTRLPSAGVSPLFTPPWIERVFLGMPTEFSADVHEHAAEDAANGIGAAVGHGDEARAEDGHAAVGCGHRRPAMPRPRHTSRES